MINIADREPWSSLDQAVINAFRRIGVILRYHLILPRNTTLEQIRRLLRSVNSVSRRGKYIRVNLIILETGERYPALKVPLPSHFFHPSLYAEMTLSLKVIIKIIGLRIKWNDVAPVSRRRMMRLTTHNVLWAPFLHKFLHFWRLDVIEDIYSPIHDYFAT